MSPLLLTGGYPRMGIFPCARLKPSLRHSFVWELSKELARTAKL
jgi:hypothetical protein